MSTKAKICLSLMALAILYNLVGAPAKPPESAAKPLPESRHFNGAHFACITPELYREVAALVHDTAALRSALTVTLARQACVLFGEREPIVVTDVQILGGLVRVRRPGSAMSYWTHTRWVD